MLPRQTRSHIYPWRHGTEGSSVTRGTHSGVALEDTTTSLEINHFWLTDARFVLYGEKSWPQTREVSFKGTSFRDGREAKTVKTCLRANDDDDDDDGDDDDDNDDDNDDNDDNDNDDNDNDDNDDDNDENSPVPLFCFTETRHEQNWKLFSHPSPVDVHENGV
ncbi:hypothetical protein V1478_009245 [Vespula squamosa]|uniref:Uncharacterized protein n=1 Tax=Vespula squamosa TaxID=30214 RepID=A0ABD2AP39_VESSQ